MIHLKRMIRRWETPPQSWRERGQALVETALVAVILVMLLSIILDMGRAFFTYVALNNAAGEGAYFGSAFPKQKGPADGSEPHSIIGRAKNESPRTAQLVNWADADVTVTYPETPKARENNPESGEMIQVAISYPYEFIGPVPGMFGVYSFTMYTHARQRIVADPDNELPAERQRGGGDEKGKGNGKGNNK